ncbi:MAG: phage tail protein [Planctomycetota bacterium]
MRTLTSAVLAAKDSAAPRPVGVLKIEFGGEVGTKYYADAALAEPVSAEARVLDWGPLRAALDEGRLSPGSSAHVTLADADHVLRGYLKDPGFAGKRVTILQHFRGLGESDLVPLFAGVAGAAPLWEEALARIALPLADLSVLFQNRPCGTLASRELFPKLRDGDEGKMLPLVYGRPHRVRALLAAGGAETVLARRATASDAALFVKDASRFPAGPVRLRIGSEEIEGSFSGNAFAVTARACGIESGTTAVSSGKYLVLRAASLLAATDNEYAGLFLRLTLGGREQMRHILYSVAATNALIVNAPFLGPDGNAAILGPGVDFEIATVGGVHPAGERVTEVLDEYVYIAADHPVEAVDAVEGWGIVRPEVRSDGEVFVKEEEGYVTLPPQYYTIRPNDADTFPALGHAVATIKLRRLPLTLPQEEFLGHDLFVSLRGCTDGEGSLITNPAGVIEHLLRTQGGLGDDEIDAPAFEAAAAASAGREFAFALDRPGPALAVAADLAFQACLALAWEEGRVRPIVLRNDAGPALDTLDAGRIEEGSVRLEESDTEIVTSLVARYTHRGAPAALTVSDAEAEALHGAHPRTIEFWAYGGRHEVRLAAEWWLRRRRHRYRRVSLGTFLAGLALQRGDAVAFDRTDLLSPAQTGRVAAVDHLPARLARGRMDRIRLTLELPTWAGCATGCEHACESTGCESASCELSCTAGEETSCAWTCETTCEEACQLSCTATCELSCQSTCQLSCRSAGETGCGSGCETACETGCETGCETSCEGWACESSDETGCATACQTATIETLFPVREVEVLSGVSSQYGPAVVIQTDKNGSTFGASFTAYDPFDVHPMSGETGTVYLNFNYQWVFVPSHRNVKYVSIVDSAGGEGRYEVQEQSFAGSPWGATFYAWAVDSV